MSNELTKQSQTSNSNLATRRSFKKNVEWILADDSGSMSSSIPNTNPILTRAEALNQTIAQYGPEIQTISFGVRAHKHIGPTSFHGRAGNTLLAPGLELVREYEPNYILIISDGVINDIDSACALAHLVAETAIIDTLYIGAEEPYAIENMRRLAEIGHGRFKHLDLTKSQTLSLTQAITGLLPPPETDESVEL